MIAITSLVLANTLKKMLLEYKKYKEAGQSSSIRDKVNFAKTAVAFMKNEADLSDDAKQLAEKILNFIKSNNK